MLTILSMLFGCDVLSPFVGEELKASVCDRDHDGLGRASDFCDGEDCDDADDAIGAPSGWYRDVDLDTYGAGEEEFSCSQPEGFVSVTGDCDDTDELVSPGGIESCNSIDDDCDDEIDEENILVWYLDADQDTWGNEEIYLVQCDEPVGYVDNAQDCDDLEPTINPDGTEVCDDGIDQDCNDLLDDAEGSQIWYADVDLDGYGDPATSLYSCVESVTGYVLNASDCDDTNLDVNPSANEACRDEVDNDCDGEVDTDAVDVTWYADVDEDGYGDANATTTDCAPPEGYVGNSEDCDDATSVVNPGVEEVCNNGVDDNCDGSANACRLSGSLTPADATLAILADAGQFGCAIAFGDFNGDGADDLAVGAYEDETESAQAGAVFFFWGPLTDTGEINAGSYDARILGTSSSQLGRNVVSVDDLNGDGIDDLAVGAIGSDLILVFFLPLTGNELTATDADFTLSGLAAGGNGDDGFGISSGDLNNDGLNDLVVSGYDSDQTWVFWGPLTQNSGNLSSAGAVFQGGQEGDRFGYSVAVGDFSGDGLDDMAVGAPEASSSNDGEVYVYVGPVSSSSTADFTLTGTSNERYGSESFAVDLNGDGISDLGTSRRQAWGVRISWGGTLSSASDISTDTWDAILGAGKDLDGDGIPDLLIAQPAAGGYTCGTAACVSIVYGSSDATTATNGTWYSDSEVTVVGAGAPEFTLDGVPDILIGTPEENTVWLMAGTGI